MWNASKVAEKLVFRFRIGDGTHANLLVDSLVDVPSLLDAISIGAEKEGFNTVRATSNGHGLTVLEGIASALRDAFPSTSVRPSRETHPSMQFRRVFDDVIDNLKRPLILILDLDPIDALPNAYDVLAAIRAALMPRRGQVFALFLVGDEAVRRRVFNNYDHPMYLFAFDFKP
jgi:hypothetical protein